jgi:hypothetical protein
MDLAQVLASPKRTAKGNAHETKMANANSSTETKK